MVDLHERYQINLRPEEWNMVMKKYLHADPADEIIIERAFSGELAECKVTGIGPFICSKPHPSLRRPLYVEVTRIPGRESEETEDIDNLRDDSDIRSSLL